MSFRSLGAESGRAFECVRRSLLQREGLPFADVLMAERLQEAFDAEEVEFGDADDPDVVYTPAMTLWAFLSQMLFTGEQRSCQAAVARVATVAALRGREVSDTNTGASCRARSRIPESVPQRLARELARDCESQLPDELRWQGRRTFLVDGTTFSMPDTPKNQAEFPQSSSQSEGLGFPICRAVALISLGTAMVCGLALGPYSGKETGETALFRELLPLLRAGDLVVADRYYGGWFLIALLQERGVDVVTRLHLHRVADFHRGRRLGADDHLVEWPKPQRPDWLDPDTYARLPATLTLREMIRGGQTLRALRELENVIQLQESSGQDVATDLRVLQAKLLIDFGAQLGTGSEIRWFTHKIDGEEPIQFAGSALAQFTKARRILESLNPPITADNGLYLLSLRAAANQGRIQQDEQHDRSLLESTHRALHELLRTDRLSSLHQAQCNHLLGFVHFRLDSPPVWPGTSVAGLFDILAAVSLPSVQRMVVVTSRCRSRPHQQARLVESYPIVHSMCGQRTSVLVVRPVLRAYVTRRGSDGVG